MGPIKDQLMQVFGFTKSGHGQLNDMNHQKNLADLRLVESKQLVSEADKSRDIDTFRRRPIVDCDSCKWTEFGTIFGLGCYVAYHLKREYTTQPITRSFQIYMYRGILITSSLGNYVYYLSFSI